MEENKEFPKYQYSRFDSKQGQYVVRTNIKEEFEEMIGYMNRLIDKETTSTVPVKPYVSADTFTNDHICPVHKTPMKERKTIEGQTYWDHRKQDPPESGHWVKCNGRGFK